MIKEQAWPEHAQFDARNLDGQLTAARARINALSALAERAKLKTETYRAGRKKRAEDLKAYQNIILDLEHWLLDAQGKLGAELKLTNVKAVRDHLNGNKVHRGSRAYPE